jgi:hypothetical protein
VAKRKSTDKTSNQADTEDKVESDSTSESQDQTDSTSRDADMVDSAAEAVDSDFPLDDAPESPDREADENADALSDVDVDTVSKDETDRLQDDASESEAPSLEPIDATETTEVADAMRGDDHLSEEEAERLIEDVENSDGSAAKAEPVFETEPKPTEPQVIRETTVERKGGFFPMLLGGVVAAGLGYGVAAYLSQELWPFETAAESTFEDDVRGQLSELDGTLSDLGSRVQSLEEAVPTAVDLSPIEDQIAVVESSMSDVSTGLDEFGGRIDDLSGRVDALERQPMEQAVSPEAIAAYERALAELRTEVEAQRAEVAQMAQEAVTAEQNAEEQATLAAARTAMAEITSAMESGEGYADAVSVLSSNGVDVPPALADNANNGVPTLGSLIESFPEASRAALSEARSTAMDGTDGVGRVASFFADQLGARSVAPRDGDNPDAILSRAEALVRSGDIAAALDELAGLPDVAQAALTDWQARAETRLEAKTAADDLVQRLLQE